MSDMIVRLRERRNKVWEDLKAIADRATEENRQFDAAEQGQWDAMNEELDKLDTRIKSAVDTEQRAKDQDEAFNRLTSKPEDRRSGSGGTAPPDNDRVAELRKFALGEPGAPRVYEVRPEGPVEQRLLSKLSAGAGANLVPTTFYDRLIQHLIETSAVLQAGPTVITTDSGETIQFPKTTAHSSAAIVTEGNQIATSEPAFGQVALSAFKYANMMYASRELLQDSGVDLEGYLSMQAGRAIGNAFGQHMIIGTGTTQPRGIITDATSGVTGSTVAGGASVIGAPTADNLIDLFYSVIAPYRNSRNAAWLVKDSTMASIRKLKDTTGQYLFQPSLVLGTPDTLIGKPIYTDPYVPAIATGAKSVVFGDFSQYFVRMVGGVRFERSDDFKFDTDQVSFRVVLRADAALVDLTGALKFLTGGVA
jgi:HK97 family phage major capsid protein